MTYRSKLAKRLIDIVVGILGLTVFAPLMIGVALVVLVTMGRPVVFSQQRPGLNGQPFRLFKFRTMKEKLDAKGDPLPDEQRLTTTGSWLRRFSFDELPQLFNVLRGDMSLVGPRPLLMEYLSLYSPRQANRHRVRPGITGWAQVNGRNAVSWPQRFELDVWYVEHQSLVLDLRILLLTVRKVISGRGVSAEGEVTMSRFTGNHGNGT